MKAPDYYNGEPSEEFPLTWRQLWRFFTFMLSSPRRGKLKLMITDYGYDYNLKCANGHERCFMGPTEECPYCERDYHWNGENEDRYAGPFELGPRYK